MPASRRRTGLPTITPWCARSARSPGLRLRPLLRCCLLSSRGLREKYTHVQRFPEIGIITLLRRVMAHIGDARTRVAAGPKKLELGIGVQSSMGLMRPFVRNAEERWSRELG